MGHEVGDTNVTTGSGKVRWHSERRAAMQTAVEYTRAKYGRGQKVRLVWAGHEPSEFVDLFPFWTVDPSVKDINQNVSASMIFVGGARRKAKKKLSQPNHIFSSM